MNDWNAKIIDEFRAKGGRGVTNFGDRLLLLTVRGARSGQPQTIPLAFHRDGDRFVVAASKGGSPTNPDWYRNLVANPDVVVEVGGARFAARAVALPEGPARDRLYARHAELMPGFAEYEKRTPRTIPVIVLEPESESVAA